MTKLLTKTITDTISEIFMSYATTLYYFREFSKNTISQKSFENNIFFALKFGKFYCSN